MTSKPGAGFAAFGARGGKSVEPGDREDANAFLRGTIVAAMASMMTFLAIAVAVWVLSGLVFVLALCGAARRSMPDAEEVAALQNSTDTVAQFDSQISKEVEPGQRERCDSPEEEGKYMPLRLSLALGQKLHELRRDRKSVV